jgi:hypothetical protein
VGKRFYRLPTRLLINGYRVGTNVVPTVPGLWQSKSSIAAYCGIIRNCAISRKMSFDIRAHDAIVAELNDVPANAGSEQARSAEHDLGLSGNRGSLSIGNNCGLFSFIPTLSPLNLLA